MKSPEAIKSAVAELVDLCGKERTPDSYPFISWEQLEIIIAAIKALRPVDEGLSVIVPVEPSETMKAIADDVLDAIYSDEQHKIEAGFVWAKIHRAVTRAIILDADT